MKTAISNKNKIQLVLLFVCADKLFLKKAQAHIAKHSFDIIVVKHTGEELAEYLAANPLPKKSMVLAAAELSLADREHPLAQNGIDLLLQVKKLCRDAECALVLSPTEKAAKNTAAKKGIEAILTKNDNFGTRFDLFVKNQAGYLKVKAKRQSFINYAVTFAAFSAAALATVLAVSYLQ
jgi:ActR/RegA family two-component response regulator